MLGVAHFGDVILTSPLKFKHGENSYSVQLEIPLDADKRVKYLRAAAHVYMCSSAEDSTWTKLVQRAAWIEYIRAATKSPGGWVTMVDVPSWMVQHIMDRSARIIEGDTELIVPESNTPAPKFWGKAAKRIRRSESSVRYTGNYAVNPDGTISLLNS